VRYARLANIAVRAVTPEDGHAVSNHFLNGFFLLPVKPLNEILNEQWHMFETLFEWGQFDLKNRKTMVEVFPQPAPTHGLSKERFEAAIRGHRSVSLCATQREESGLLKDLHQLGRDIGPHFRNLVEQQRSRIGLFEAAPVPPIGPVKEPRSWPNN
jgi:hypothetical protein